MIHDLPRSWCITGTDGSTLVMDSSVPLMHHDPERSWVTGPDTDHLKGTHPKILDTNPAPRVWVWRCYKVTAKQARIVKTTLHDKPFT